MATRLDVVKEESLYINPEAQVSIFKGTISQGRLKVAIKEQVHSSPYSANFAIREALSHAQLTHEHICVMYDCYLTQTGSGDLKTVIVTELLESDLDKEIRTRKASNNYWTETELLAFLEQVTSALAFAQGKGISHRDIKPQNIFVTNDMLKIGDFGSSARNVDLEEFAKTVQGSPLFLSPELKRGYMKQMNDRSYKMEPYDPFASDVYSLGVTFLYLARLEPPMELTKLEQLQTAAERVVQELGMPRLGQILLHMLQEVPSNRKSFEFLHQELESFGALSSPYFPQQESDPLNPPERQSAALEERKTINVLDVGQSGLGRKGCSTCLEPIVDFTWQSSLPADLQVFVNISSDFCSLKCLDGFVVSLDSNNEREDFREYFKKNAPILKGEGIRRWPYCNEKEKSGTIQPSVLHNFELIVRPLCENCREKEYDFKLMQGELTYLCGDCFREVQRL